MYCENCGKESSVNPCTDCASNEQVTNQQTSTYVHQSNQSEYYQQSQQVPPQNNQFTQQGQFQQNYQQPPYNQYQQAGFANPQVSSFDNPISVKHWVLNLLLLMIPIANIVFLIIWAVGAGNTSEIKRNYARATLIMMAIAFGVVLIINLFIFALVISTIPYF
ncbi:hypothetical protein MTP04_06560 [Lysinibacillus sp. PLM2]|nr:hypothetical protein MTP04_06560 [Lysinibacillus sp. PLM2]